MLTISILCRGLEKTSGVPDKKLYTSPNKDVQKKMQKGGKVVKKKKKGYKKHQERKREIAGKKVIGIDPAKEKHQVTVIDEQGIQMGNSFSINVSHKGFSEDIENGISVPAIPSLPEQTGFLRLTTGIVHTEI